LSLRSLAHINAILMKFGYINLIVPDRSLSKVSIALKTE
jgi:hypothetical protein